MEDDTFPCEECGTKCFEGSHGQTFPCDPDPPRKIRRQDVAARIRGWMGVQDVVLHTQAYERLVDLVVRMQKEAQRGWPGTL